MDRMDEYKKLMLELINTPTELTYTLTRVKARKIKNLVRKWITIPIYSFVSIVLVFILMVNISPTFAEACEKIPFLEDLVTAVKFSPSLSKAVENEYVQPINLEQTENEITMKIEYVIVDQKQLNVFYTLSSKKYSHLTMEPGINNIDGTKMQGFTLTSFNPATNESGKIRYLIVDFIEQDMPSTMQLQCKVYDYGDDPMIYKVNPVEGGVSEELAETKDVSEIKEESEIKEISKANDSFKTEEGALFTFQLEFDPSFTAQGKIIEINKTFVLDGQTLTITNAEVYPTHMQFNLLADNTNTSWLKSLFVYATDENGNRFDSVSKGISALGSSDSPMMSSYRIESSFFCGSENLNLHITGAEWLDKDMKYVKVNLKEKTADNLPEGVTFDKAVKTKSGWKLTFSAQMRKENFLYQIFNGDYFDEAGKEYRRNSYSSITSDLIADQSNDETQEDKPQVFSEIFLLEGYTDDTVYLSPNYSHFDQLDDPVIIKMK